MSRNSSTVYIVDDDKSLRKALVRLIESEGFNTKTFSSAQEFIRILPLPDVPSCLVLDVCMPGMNGLELQKELALAENGGIPIIFLTGHGDIPMSVNAMKKGAIDFLSKPCNDKELLNAIKAAIAKNSKDRLKQARIAEIRQRINCLTLREYEVMAHVITGLLNKQIAYKMKISEKTVKVHRGRVMQKMKVQSVAELVTLTREIGIDSSSPPPPPRVRLKSY